MKFFLFGKIFTCQLIIGIEINMLFGKLNTAIATADQVAISVDSQLIEENLYNTL